MSNKLRDQINLLTDTQKGDALEYFLSDNRFNRAVAVLEKTTDDFIFHLENNNIVESLRNKDDKSFDRAKGMMKDLLSFVQELEDAKMSALNIEQSKDFTKKAHGNSVMAVIKEAREKAQQR